MSRSSRPGAKATLRSAHSGGMVQGPGVRNRLRRWRMGPNNRPLLPVADGWTARGVGRRRRLDLNVQGLLLFLDGRLSPAGSFDLMESNAWRHFQKDEG